MKAKTNKELLVEELEVLENIHIIFAEHYRSVRDKHRAVVEDAMVQRINRIRSIAENLEECGHKRALVHALPECIDAFTTPYMHGIIVGEDATHIWINSIVNRYPKYMVTIKYL